VVASHPPTNYVEAALQQHSKIDHALNKLCKLLAKCSLTGNEAALQQAFLNRMHTASAKQHSEGQCATWFTVDFGDDSEIETIE